MPISDSHFDFVVLEACFNFNRSTGLGVLRRVADHVRDHLREPGRIAVDDEPARNVDREVMLPLLEQRAHGFDGRCNDVGHIDRLVPQFDLAACDS